MIELRLSGLEVRHLMRALHRRIQRVEYEVSVSNFRPRPGRRHAGEAELEVLEGIRDKLSHDVPPPAGGPSEPPA